jgi:hypothetical protein
MEREGCHRLIAELIAKPQNQKEIKSEAGTAPKEGQQGKDGPRVGDEQEAIPKTPAGEGEKSPDQEGLARRQEEKRKREVDIY